MHTQNDNIFYDLQNTVFSNNKGMSAQGLFLTRANENGTHLTKNGKLCDIFLGVDLRLTGVTFEKKEIQGQILNQMKISGIDDGTGEKIVISILGSYQIGMFLSKLISYEMQTTGDDLLRISVSGFKTSKGIFLSIITKDGTQTHLTSAFKIDVLEIEFLKTKISVKPIVKMGQKSFTDDYENTLIEAYKKVKELKEKNIKGDEKK